MATTWDPEQYLRFETERARAFHDLVAQVADLAPATVVDLGCGPGQLTAALAEHGANDPLRPQVTATRDGDEWRLDGDKPRVPAAHVGDRGLVPASTGDGELGVFLVDPAGPGVERTVAATTDQLWLQTSEGPYSTSTKLQVVAEPVGVLAATAADAHPTAKGSTCPDAPRCKVAGDSGCRS